MQGEAERGNAAVARHLVADFGDRTVRFPVTNTATAAQLGTQLLRGVV